MMETKYLLYPSFVVEDVEARLRGVLLWSNGAGDGWVCCADSFSYKSCFGSYGYVEEGFCVVCSVGVATRFVYVVLGGLGTVRGLLEAWKSSAPSLHQLVSFSLDMGSALTPRSFGSFVGGCFGALLGGCVLRSAYGVHVGFSCVDEVSLLDAMLWVCRRMLGESFVGCSSGFNGASFYFGVDVYAALNWVCGIVEEYLSCYLGLLRDHWGSLARCVGYDFDAQKDFIMNRVWLGVLDGFLEGVSDYVSEVSLCHVVLHPEVFIQGGEVSLLASGVVEPMDGAKLSMLGFSGRKALLASYVSLVGDRMGYGMTDAFPRCCLVV